MRSFCTDSKEEEIILGWFTYLDSDLLSIDFFFGRHIESNEVKSCICLKIVYGF